MLATMMSGYSAGGWTWALMIPMLLVWVGVLGLAVYAALRLPTAGSRSPQDR